METIHKDFMGNPLPPEKPDNTWLYIIIVVSIAAALSIWVHNYLAQ